MKLLAALLVVTISTENRGLARTRREQSVNFDLEIDGPLVIDGPVEPIPNPLQRLEELNQLVESHLTQWFHWLPSQESWIRKFRANGERMASSFHRCGNYDEYISRKRRELGSLVIDGPTDDDSDVVIEVESPYDQFDPSKGLEVLVVGYRNWAERYLSGCAGQRKHNHQVRRMNKWDTKLQAHLDNASCKFL